MSELSELFGRLVIDTDDDFCIEFCGQVFCEHTIELQLFCLADLNCIHILQRNGLPFNDQTKCYELLRDIERIKLHPAVSFDTTGGNRGCTWFSNI